MLYRVKRGPKLVLFWHMVAVGPHCFKPNDEVDRLEWLLPSQAMSRLDHAEERQLVRSAAASLGMRPGSAAA